MSKAWFRVLAAVALCAATTTGTAVARDHDRGHENSKAVWTGAHDRDHDRTWNHNRHRDWDRDRDHDRDHRAWERTHARNPVFGGSPSQRPPGWDRGRKTGWNNCDVPPGQAKKVGCTPVFNRNHRRWEARRREERREAWWQAHRRREQVMVAQQNSRTRPVPRHDVRPDRDHDRR